MNAGWEAKPIGEVCKIKPLKSEASAKLADDAEVSFAPMEDLGIGQKYLQSHQTRRLGEVSGSYTYFADGDVLLAKITPCFENGKLGVARGLTNGVGFGSSEYIVLRPLTALDAEFLYYFLARSTFREEGARSMTGAVGHKRVAKEFVAKYPIPLPTIPEQRRVVAILDEAFEAIAAAKANTEKNLQNALELPGVVVRRALAIGGDSWAESRIGDQIMLQRGFDITKDQQRDGSVPVVSSGGIRSYHDTPMVRAPGVVMGRKGTLGKVFYLEEDFWPHDTTLWVKDFKGNDPRFVYRFFEVLEVKGLDSGAANPALNRNQVHALRVLWPPVDVQVTLAERIEGIVTSASKLASIHAAKLTALDELKESLLHQAFAGQLTAKSTDRQLEAVA